MISCFVLDAAAGSGYHLVHSAACVRWVRVTICSESGQVREEAAIRSLCRAPGSIEGTGAFFVRRHGGGLEAEGHQGGALTELRPSRSGCLSLQSVYHGIAIAGDPSSIV